MKHSLDETKLGQFGPPIADAVQKCVHCGFCLPTCPTYQVLGQEMDSPRGRILLMKEVLEENLRSSEAAMHIDQCLGCLACETSCPSGVPYGDLLNSYRALQNDAAEQTWENRIRTWLVHQTVPYPNRFRWAAWLGKWVAAWSSILPAFLRPMLGLVPDKLPPMQPTPAFSPAIGESRGSVGLLAGCAQQVLAPGINAATISVLNKIGFDVVVPAAQGCCGGLDWHAGRAKATRKFASHNFPLFDDTLSAIITNAAGCGSAIHEYPLAFRGTPEAEQAAEFSNRVVDIASFLVDQAIPPMRMRTPMRIAYHDACHLAHAQGIREPPRELLRRIQNVELVPLAASDTCCGSAGTYNLTQPEIASELGMQKAKTIINSGCELVTAGNIGCLVQIEKHLKAEGSPVRVMHTIEILDQALPNPNE